MKLINRIKSCCLTLLLLAGPAWSADPTIGILIYDGVLTSDVTGPAEVFGVASREAWFRDYDVAFISVEDNPRITTEEGLVLTPDYHITNAPSLDVLILPSSYDMDWLLKHRPLTAFIRAQAQTAKWLGSNCSGAFLLANAGLLDGKRATTWAGGEKDLQKEYPNITVIEDENVVIDGNVITSNGSLVSYQAALVLLAKLSSTGRAREVFDALQMSRLTDWVDITKYLEN